MSTKATIAHGDHFHFYHEVLASFVGALVYGGAEEPREQQVARGMEYFRGERLRSAKYRLQLRSCARCNDRLLSSNCKCSATTRG